MTRNYKKFVMMVFLAFLVFSGVVMAGSLGIVNNTKDLWISFDAVQTNKGTNRMLDEFLDWSGSIIIRLGPGESTKATWADSDERPEGTAVFRIYMESQGPGGWKHEVNFLSQKKQYFEFARKWYEYFVTSRGNDYTFTIQPLFQK